MRQYKVKFNDGGTIKTQTVTAPNMAAIEEYFSTDLISVSIPQTKLVISVDNQ